MKNKATSMARPIDLNGDQVLLRLIAEASEGPFKNNVIKCTNTIIAAEQMDCIRRITNTLLTEGEKLNDQEISLGIELVVVFFFEAETNTPLKRLSQSCLVDLTSKYGVEKIEVCCGPRYKRYLSIWTSGLPGSSLSIDAGLDIAHVADTISQLLTFDLGRVTVQKSLKDVLKFVGEAMEFCENGLGVCKSAPETEKVYQALAKLIKCASNFFSISGFVSGDNNPENKDIIRSFAIAIEDLVRRLLLSEKTVIQCRIGCGIAYATISRFCHYPNHLEKMFNLEAFENRMLSLSCYISGLVNVVGIEELLIIKYDSNKSYLLYLLNDQLLSVHLNCKEPWFLLTISRALNNLLAKMMFLLNQDSTSEIREDLKIALNASVPSIFDRIVDFVWTYWEYYIDVLVEQVMLIFKSTLKLCAIVREDSDQYIRQVTNYLIELPWHRKGKYECIIAATADYVTVTECVTSHPDMIQAALLALEERSMACYTKDFVERLSQKHYKECDSRMAIDEWKITWLDPFVNMVQKSDLNNNVYTSLYQTVLPILVEVCPSATDYVLDNFQQKGDLVVPTSIKCLQVDRNAIENLEKWASIIDQGIVHNNEQVRLDTLRLLTEHPKLSSPVSEFCLERVKSYVRCNVAGQMAAVRHQFVSSMKKLLHRIYDSSIALWRPFLKKKKTSEDAAPTTPGVAFDRQKQFVEWLWNYCFERLFPGCSFFTRSTLFALIQLQTQLSDSKGNVAHIVVLWTPERAQTLFGWLKDPFETNKAIVLDIIQNIPKELFGFNETPIVGEYLTAALEYAKSVRPPDSVTASYLYRLLCGLCPDQVIVVTSQSDTTSRDLLDNKLNPKCRAIVGILNILKKELEKEISMAGGSLLEASASGPMYGVLLCIRTLLKDIDWRFIITSSDIEVQNVFRIFFASLLKSCFDCAAVVSPIVSNSSPEGQLDIDNNPDVLVQVQAALQKGLGRSFELKRDHRPTTDVDTGSGETETTVDADLKNMTLNGDAGQNFSSRGGECVIDADIAHSDNGIVHIDAVKTLAVTAQMLLLCGWRAHKETSLLFGDVSDAILPIVTEPRNDTAVISYKQVIDIGEYFMRELSSVRHRGAFEQAYTAFLRLCNTLWRSSDPDLQQLPTEWFETLVRTVKAGEVSGTRRSAGIPFITQAILVSEPGVRGMSVFHRGMELFLSLALADNSDIKDTTKVHALNVLRSLYRDQKLGDHVMPFVARGVEAAIKGYDESNWAIRNSATLLFSALITRIFGVQRSSATYKIDAGSEEERDADRKNCLTGHVFFLRFPALFTFLLGRFKCVDFGKSLKEQTPLFPVLLLLSRLIPSITESSFRLSEFLPFLDQCCASPVWHIRQLASKASVALLSFDDRLKYIVARAQIIPLDSAGKINQNAVHGVLLQFKRFVSLDAFSGGEDETSIKETLRREIMARDWLVSDQNKCDVTRSAFLELLLKMREKELLSIDDVECDQNVSGYLWASFDVRQGCRPGYDQFCQLRARYLLAISAEAGDLCLMDTLVRLFRYIGGKAERLATLMYASRIKRLAEFDETMSSVEHITELTVAILRDEGDQDTLRYVFALLNILPMKLVNECMSSGFSEPVEYVLDRMNNDCRNEDTYEAVFDFWTRFVCYRSSTISSVTEKSRPLCLLLEVVEDNAMPDRDFQRRFGSATALKRVLSIFNLKDIPSECAAYFWRAWIALLQDDEMKVRTSAYGLFKDIDATTRENLSASSTLEPALERALLYCVEILPKDVALDLFVNWILTPLDVPLEAECDEQPFDKGELNTYFEELTLATACARIWKEKCGNSVNLCYSPLVEKCKCKMTTCLERYVRKQCELTLSRQVDVSLIEVGQCGLLLRLLGEENVLLERWCPRTCFIKWLYDSC